ncbi:hypothetical protein CXG81DRAFT_11792 [Caulochytrium protostelioides]|uniref:Vacuolar transporter chaperone complex subunit 4 n=2 Tax=Caulochytrium protostelioides TaxID=1555241 RepID=A0A4P9X8H4_9FUNG|nr:hypothetical protein CXG81DRAFT_11792 [Caulochytrium protostelioides]|eukprot:RKP01597.1 hypothetical protein CXG81DRAFT_11792 [Caulochytrium protostelioides]
MKFGEQLKANLLPAWRFYYMDYDDLKASLNGGKHGEAFTEKDEAAFVEKLERELDRVADFRHIKGDELIRRVQHCEATATSILQDKTSEQVEENETALQRLQQEIECITAEVTELSRFVRLNYSGFMKILKKHDKRTSYKLKPMFMVRLSSRPFYVEPFDAVILRLSHLFDTVRHRGRRDADVAAAEAAQVASSGQFVRRTTKYWVHPDNVTEVKCLILQYLPVLVFNAGRGRNPDPAISSVYFDNASFELYNGRLEKTEGAQAIRVRWYGGMDQTEMFVERKTHHEDWTGETSVKTRFAIKEKYVNAYLKGEYDLEHSLAKDIAKGRRTEEQVAQTRELAQEVQQTIAEKNLRPMLRTFYNRTAFQLPGDARVRISLDTDLAMIREDDGIEDDGVTRAGDNWRRMDIGSTVDSFKNLPASEICRFPYAVLEVKLQTQTGATPPDWVTALTESDLVEACPKFGKFVHGIATLLESRVSLLPFWLPQMDDALRERTFHGFGGAPAGADAASRGRRARPWRRSGSQPRGGGAEDASGLLDSDGDDDADVDDDDEGAARPLLSHWLRRRRAERDAGGSMAGSLAGSASNLSTRGRAVTAATRKRIATPVRVEPKVFFANERTFLSWLHFCIVLGSLALGLLNFGDTAGKLAGVVFTGVAMLFMAYALWIYQWRAQKIRAREAGGYDDRIGPTVLVCVLFVAIMLNFYFKFVAEPEMAGLMYSLAVKGRPL